LSLCQASRFDKFDIRRFLNDLIDRTINLFSASIVMSWSFIGRQGQNRTADTRIFSPDSKAE